MKTANPVPEAEPLATRLKKRLVEWLIECVIDTKDFLLELVKMVLGSFFAFGLAAVVLVMILISWIAVYVKYKTWSSSLEVPTLPTNPFWFVVLPFMMWFINRVFINEYTGDDYHHSMKSWRWHWLMQHHDETKYGGKLGWARFLVHYLTKLEIYLSWFLNKSIKDSGFHHAEIEWMKRIAWVVMVLPLGLLFFGKLFYFYPIVVILFDYCSPGTAAWLNEKYDTWCVFYAPIGAYWTLHPDVYDGVRIGIIVLLVILFVFLKKRRLKKTPSR